MGMACEKCQLVKQWKYKDDSETAETKHLQHIKDCIHYANRYLIRLLSDKCKIDAAERGAILFSLSLHRGIQRYYVYKCEKLFNPLYPIICSFNSPESVHAYRVVPLLKMMRNEWISGDLQMLCSLDYFIL